MRIVIGVGLAAAIGAVGVWMLYCVLAYILIPILGIVGALLGF